ncbi:hypothetical protein ACLB1E_30235 [Escherichia coli]
MTVTLGGAMHTATVQANLSWSVDVPGFRATGAGQRRTDHFGFGDEQRGQYR